MPRRRGDRRAPATQPLPVGRAKPNAQAVTLIRLVARFPETVAQLAALG